MASLLRSVLLLFVDVVVEQLDNEVDVCQNHAPAAVPLAAQRVERVRRGHALLVDEVQEAIPFVSHHLATGEAAHRNNHFINLYSSPNWPCEFTYKLDYSLQRP